MKLKKYFLETCSIYLLLLGLWCMSSLTTQAQEDIPLTTQQAVDTIRNMLGESTVFTGNLIIGPSNDIANLDSLRFLTEITGNFEIGQNGVTNGVPNGNSALVDIGDFPFLQKIGGGYYVTQNTKLVNGGNFPVLDSIGGYFFIRSNDKLENAGTFPRLKDIGTYVSIRSNGNLRYLYDFPALTSIGDGSAWVPSSNSGKGSTLNDVSIVVEDNTLLLYCCIFTKFTSGSTISIAASIHINDNLEGCNSADQAECGVVVSLDELSIFSTSLESSFTLISNSRWRLNKPNSGSDWITTFSDGTMNVTDSLTGGNNDSITSTLITINYDQSSRSEESLTASLFIYSLDASDVATPADTLTVVIRMANPLYSGNISVSTQAAIDALAVSGAPFAEGNTIHMIQGNVVISGSVTDLSIFNNIDTITGYLRAEGLTQLRALSQASGNGDYVGLTNLRMVGGYFIVGQGEVSSLIGSSNTSLDSVGYFPRLESIGSSFEIRENTSLDAVGTFPVLRSIGGRFRLRYNHQLLHIPNFDSLVQTGKEITIEDNNGLITVGSFPRLATIGGDLNFSNNRNLTMRGTYPVLRSIGSQFKVENCDRLKRINDFPSLTTIGSAFFVSRNDSLRGIGDFPVLTTIRGNLQIQSNPLLGYCCGFSKILLDESIVSGNTTIRNNDLGCRNEEDISCDVSSRLLSDILRVPFTSTSITFMLYSPTRWKLSRLGTADWLTGLSLDGGSTNVSNDLMGNGTAVINLSYTQNDVKASRTVRLLISSIDESGTVLDSPVPDTLTLIQEENTSTLRSMNKVKVLYFADSTELSIVFNERWRLRKPDTGADWITMLSVGTTRHATTLEAGDRRSFPTDTTVTITYEELPISEFIRSAMLVLEAIGNDGNILDNVSPITITITQSVPPYTGDITLKTQQAVNTIRNTLGRSTVIIGNLIVGSSSNITDLSPLNSLTEITGNFFIGNTGVSNDALVDIGDFPALQKIGGDYYVTENPELVNGGNFPVLDSIGGYFFVRSNEKLESIGTFPRLKDVGTYVSIRSNDNLRYLYDFPALTSIGMGSTWVPSVSSTTNNPVDNVSIVVENNDSLKYCCVLTKFRMNDDMVQDSISISGSTHINNNATGCESTDINCNIFAILPTDTLVVPFYTAETTFTIAANSGWRLSNLNTDASWITSLSDGTTSHSDSLMGGQHLQVTATSVTVNYQPNTVSSSRKVNLLLSLLDEMGNVIISSSPDTMTFIQSERRSALELFSPNIINLRSASGSTELNVAANVRWQLRKPVDARWITNMSDGTTSDADTLEVDQSEVVTLEERIVTITYEAAASPSSREAVLTLVAVNEEGEELDTLDPVTIMINQSGLPSYVATTQEQVNNIRNFLGNDISIVYDLTIGPSTDITHLDSLYFLTKIMRNFQIKGNFMLENTGDLPNLRTIGGNFQVTGNLALDSLGDYGFLRHIGGDFQIGASPIIGGGLNVSLVYLGDFSSLISIAGNYSIGYNFALKTGGDFRSLERIGGDYRIDNNPLLVSGVDYPVLDSIGGDYYIYNNKLLVGLGNFSSLTYIGEDYHVENNNSLFAEGDFRSLENIVGNYTLTNNDSLLTGGNFSSLNSIGGDYSVSFNDTLMNVGDFSSLDSIGGDYSVSFNDKLIDLGNFSMLKRIGGDYTLIFNDNLPTVDDFSALNTIGGAYSISNNDNLRIVGDFPVLDSIGGYYSIRDNANLEDVGIFPMLEQIGGYFSVHNNRMLKFLRNFSGLEEVSALFNISSNPVLRSLGDFSSLDSIGGGLVIITNNELLDLGDLSSLDSIGIQDRVYVPSSESSNENGFIDGASIVIENNPELFLCCGLQNLLPSGADSVAGDVYISNNGAGCNYTTDLSSDQLALNFGDLGECSTLVLRSQTEVDTFSMVEVPKNLVIGPSSGTDVIENLNGLSSLTNLTGNLLIRGNEALDSLAGLSSLSKVGNNFYIQDNTSLSSLHGLSTLDSIGGFFHVFGNADLSNLSGILSLDTIQGDFYVRNNPSLLTLGSFPELDNIGGSYIIQGNASLRSLGYSPLQTIDSMYYVVNNPLLSSLGDYRMLNSIGVSGNSILVPSTVNDTTDGYQTGVSIVVEDNDSLSNCCILSDSLLGAVNGSIYLNNNKAECNDTTAIPICVELLEVAVPELISGNSTFTSIGIISTKKWLLIKPATGAEWINLKDGASNALDTIRGERDSTFMIFYSAYAGDEIREAVLRLEAVDDEGMTLTDPPSVMITLRQDFVRTLSVTDSNVRRLTSVSGSEVIAISSNADWQAEISGEFVDSLRFIPTGGGTVVSAAPLRGVGNITLAGSGAGELSVFYQKNTNPNERSSTLRLSVYKESIELTTPAPIEITLTQDKAPPSLTLISPSNVEIATKSTSRITITFDVGGSATGWNASAGGDTSFITLSTPLSGGRGRGLVMLTPMVNTGLDARTATITLSTIGGTGTAATATVTLMQFSGRPTLMLTSENSVSIANTATISTDSTVINFTVGGGAAGWAATLSENSFLTLSKMNGSTGMVTIKVAATANTGATARTATITLTTIEGAGTAVTATVMITQAEAPPSLMLTSPSSVEITSTSTTPIMITFDVGGGATGWSASAGTGSFITLSKGSGNAGTGIRITATPTENTGAERTATITLTTMGGTGTAVTATVMITQAAGSVTPPTEPLGVSVSKPFTLYPNPTTGKLTIEGISGYLQIYLHDFAGKEVFASSLTSSRNTIDLSHLPSGMYVITLQGEDKTWTEVLIIVN